MGTAALVIVTLLPMESLSVLMLHFQEVYVACSSSGITATVRVFPNRLPAVMNSHSITGTGDISYMTACARRDMNPNPTELDPQLIIHSREKEQFKIINNCHFKLVLY